MGVSGQILWITMKCSVETRDDRQEHDIPSFTQLLDLRKANAIIEGYFARKATTRAASGDDHATNPKEKNLTGPKLEARIRDIFSTHKDSVNYTAMEIQRIIESTGESAALATIKKTVAFKGAVKKTGRP